MQFEFEFINTCRNLNALEPCILQEREIQIPNNNLYDMQSELSSFFQRDESNQLQGDFLQFTKDDLLENASESFMFIDEKKCQQPTWDDDVIKPEEAINSETFLIVKVQPQEISQNKIEQIPKDLENHIIEIKGDKNNFDKIFKEKKIKGEFKKNTNVPKILTRIFLKYYQEFVKGQCNEELLKHHKKVKKELSSRNTNNFNISDVLQLLGDQKCLSVENQMINRKILSRIIQSTMEEEVIDNNYIKNNHLSYVMAMKIYNIRCRSKTLTERVKIF